MSAGGKSAPEPLAQAPADRKQNAENGYVCADAQAGQQQPAAGMTMSAEAAERRAICKR